MFELLLYGIQVSVDTTRAAGDVGFAIELTTRAAGDVRIATLW